MRRWKTLSTEWMELRFVVWFTQSTEMLLFAEFVAVVSGRKLKHLLCDGATKRKSFQKASVFHFISMGTLTSARLVNCVRSSAGHGVKSRGLCTRRAISPFRREILGLRRRTTPWIIWGLQHEVSEISWVKPIFVNRPWIRVRSYGVDWTATGRIYQGK
jgi:hypothetical protein